MTEVLGPESVDAAVSDRRLHWSREGGALVQVSRHRDFAGSLAFVNSVGELAEAASHHPDVDIRWDQVTLRLSTHSAGGLTEKDLDLAARIDRLLEERGTEPGDG